MSKIDDFMATLHVLAAGDAPAEQLHHAVWVVFTRFVQDARNAARHQSVVEARVVQLQDALTAAMLRENTVRFEALRSCAHELAVEWLRGHWRPSRLELSAMPTAASSL